MNPWFESFIVELSAYQLLGLGLVPALIVFFVMFFLLLRARSDRRLAEWRLYDQRKEAERFQTEVKGLEVELKQLDGEKDYLDKQLVALSTQLKFHQQYKEQQEQQTEQQFRELSRNFELLS